MRECEHCQKSIVRKNAQARYCSDKCRNYARRAAKRNPLPLGMTSRDRWIRYSARKVPLTVDGKPASSTDRGTWASYAIASKSLAGVGSGFVLGEGIGCIDLDHVLEGGKPNQQTAAFLAGYEGHYIEVSPSGDGLHIWGLAAEAPGTRRIENGIPVERYSAGRYITITGNVYQHGDLLPL